MNDDSTLRLLQQLQELQHTKLLLIDYVATSFNAEQRFYKNLMRLQTNSALMSNLLLLSVLSDKYRHFLNVAYADNGMSLVQNFRQLRRWKYAFQNATTDNGSDTNFDWPKHLDTYKLVSQCPQLERNTTHTMNFCQNVDSIARNCAQQLAQKFASEQTNVSAHVQKSAEIAVELQHILSNFCRTQPVPLLNAEQGKTKSLRNYLDFFHLFDFLIAHAHQQQRANNSIDSTNAVLPKYDFMVLDVVRDNSVASRNGTLTWRPLLILEQHEINLNTYITHSILPGYDDWLISKAQLRHCGAICWTILAICFGIFLIIVVASIAAGIAMR